MTLNALYDALKTRAPSVSVKNLDGAFPRPKIAPNKEAKAYLEAVDVFTEWLPEDLEDGKDARRFASEYRDQIQRVESVFDQEEDTCREQRLEQTKKDILSYLNREPFAVPMDNLWLKGNADVGLVDTALVELVASGNVFEEHHISKEPGYEGHRFTLYHNVRSKWDMIKRLFGVSNNVD